MRFAFTQDRILRDKHNPTGQLSSFELVQEVPELFILRFEILLDLLGLGSHLFRGGLATSEDFGIV